MHVLLCVGSTKKEAYATLYKYMKQSGVGGTLRTLVYSKCIRETVRQRFNEPGGQHDAQYEYKTTVCSFFYGYNTSSNRPHSAFISITFVNL